jgi:outer membrane protein assembly factor BamB
MKQALRERSRRRPTTGWLLFACLALAAAGASVTAQRRAQEKAQPKPRAAGPPSATAPSPLPEWPQWGGPRRNFMSEAKGLASSWPSNGPRQLWGRRLGDGHSAIVVDNGKLYTMYSRGNQETVIALDATTSKTLWEHTYDAPQEGMNYYEQGYGPHATPLIVGSLIYTAGATGKLHALDKQTGRVVWFHDLWKEYNGTKMGRGYSCSPLAYKQTVIVTVGGPGQALMAFNQKDGSVVWKNQSFDPSPASPMIINVDGQEQMVAFMGNELFCSSAYGSGSRVLKLSRGGEKTNVQELWFNNRVRVHIGNVIRLGDHVYGASGDFGPSFLTAVEVKTGKIAWQDRSFARTNFLHADGKLIILDEDGHLALATVSPQGLQVHAKTQLLSNKAWTVPTLVGTKLYVRDRKVIMALELG